MEDRSRPRRHCPASLGVSCSPPARRAAHWPMATPAGAHPWHSPEMRNDAGAVPGRSRGTARGRSPSRPPPVVIGPESAPHRPGFEVPGSAWSTVRSACLLLDPTHAQRQRGTHGRCRQPPLPHDAASARAGVPASMHARRTLDACAVCSSTWPYTFAVIAVIVVNAWPSRADTSFRDSPAVILVIGSVEFLSNSFPVLPVGVAIRHGW